MFKHYKKRIDQLENHVKNLQEDNQELKKQIEELQKSFDLIKNVENELRAFYKKQESMITKSQAQQAYFNELFKS